MKKLTNVALLILLLSLPVLTEARGHGKHYCQTCPRDKHGKIKRNSNERRRYLKSQGLDHTPEGYQVDHIVPLAKGGPDKTYNMQLIPKNSEKEKNELR